MEGRGGVSSRVKTEGSVGEGVDSDGGHVVGVLMYSAGRGSLADRLRTQTDVMM